MKSKEKWNQQWAKLKEPQQKQNILKDQLTNSALQISQQCECRSWAAKKAASLNLIQGWWLLEVFHFGSGVIPFTMAVTFSVRTDDSSLEILKHAFCINIKPVPFNFFQKLIKFIWLIYNKVPKTEKLGQKQLFHKLVPNLDPESSLFRQINYAYLYHI